MAKSNQIKKLVNGEIADADDINDIVESAGNEGGSIPYHLDTDERDSTGGQSLGAVAYPWGSLYLNRDAILGEVDPVSNTLASSVTISDLRKFISQKDTPNSYSGESGKSIIVNTGETGLEFSNISSLVFISRTTWSSAGNSGNISINGGKRYKVILRMYRGSPNTNVYIRVNSLNSNYAYILSGEDSTAAYTLKSASDSTGIKLSNSTGNLTAEFLLTTRYSDNETMQVTGTLWDFKGSNFGTANFGGYRVVGATITDFEIATSGISDGEVLVYEYAGF